MLKRLYLDFETRSLADIEDVGASKYAEDPSTDIHCVGFLFENHLRLLKNPFLCDQTLLLAALDPNVIFVAHNAFFEQVIWREIMVKRYGYPEIPIHRWRCTMAKSWAHSLPGKLGVVCDVLDLPYKKNPRGTYLINLLCKPKKDGTFWQYHEKPAEFEELYFYCCGDVMAMYSLDNRLRDLTPREQRVWEIDQRMNHEGVMLDMPLVHKVRTFIARFQGVNLAKFFNYTGLKPTQGKKFREWVVSHLGIPMENYQGPTVARAKLSVPGNVDSYRWIHETFEIFQETQKTSLAKYNAMVDLATPSGLLREILAYHAAHTGRWGGRGVQLQNLPRPKYDLKTLVAALLQWDYDTFLWMYGQIPKPLSSAIRAMIIARAGKEFYIADFAQIEARYLAWAARDDRKLDMFRNDIDTYCVAASAIYGRVITKADEHERQTGKVGELSLGYAGGVNAYAKMGAQYDVDLGGVFYDLWSRASAEEKNKAEWSVNRYYERNPENPLKHEAALAADIIKQRWRKANPLTVQYWKDLENAAAKAIYTGNVIPCGRSLWFTSDIFLVCRLPSGRDMFYPFPKITEAKRKNSFSISYYGMENGQFVRRSTYGGKFAENDTQAGSRDFIAEGIVRLEERGYPVAFHSHDETISEVWKGLDLHQTYCDILAEAPTWASGFPIKVEGKVMERYGK